MIHIPVLLADTLQLLIKDNENGIYLDLTTGEGGHSREILNKIKSDSRLICFDRDPDIQEIAKENLKEFSNVTYVHENFSHIKRVLDQIDIKQVKGILADLGLSLYHYKESLKGFSFLKETPLDMSLDSSSENAYRIVNQYSREEIADIIYQYGEERFARKIASHIVEYRRNKPIETTLELAEIIKKTIPSTKRKKGFHPATKTFQALRIYINKELVHLKEMLKQSIRVLQKNGRLIVISYHSLEDRIVKHYFKEQESMKEIRILTKKPIIPTTEEILKNSSARSAKLRAIEKL